MDNETLGRLLLRVLNSEVPKPQRSLACLKELVVALPPDELVQDLKTHSCGPMERGLCGFSKLDKERHVQKGACDMFGHIQMSKRSAYVMKHPLLLCIEDWPEASGSSQLGL